MSRTLAAAAEVVAVVVAVAAAIPTGGTSLLAATLGVTGTAASAIAAGVGLAASGLEMLANRPKPPTVNPTEWKADPQAGIPYVFGYTYVGGNIIYRATSGKNNEYQNLVTIISGGGPIDGFDQFFVDSSYRIVGSDGTVDIADRGKMWMHTQLGHAPEAAALPMSPGSPASWTAMSKLSGYAATVVTLQYDAKGSVTFTSVPQCGWTVRGVRIYDPRLDSTYPGGNGPQRANDESTWIWSQNPILHALTWLIGRRQNGKLVLGVGLSLSGVLMAQFVEAANIADANVWITGGCVYSTDDKWNVFKQMLQAGGAEPMRLGAQVGCIINTPRVSLATIGEGDVIGDASVQATQARRDRINAIVPRYMAQQTTVVPDVSTTTTWSVVGGSPVVVDDYVVFDGRQRQKEVAYSLVQCFSGDQPTQVGQLARYDIENAREFGPITLPLKLRWMGYAPGDVVTCNLPELGLVNQDVLILSRTLSPQNGTVTVTARSETAGKHAFALGQTLTAPATPSVSGPLLLPTPGSAAWAITAETLSANGTTIPALVIEGAVDSGSVDAVVFEYRVATGNLTSDDGWIAAGVEAPATTVKAITGVKDGTAYQCAVSYRVGPNTGPRAILGPVTAGITSVPFSTGVTGPSKPAPNATNSADPNSAFGTGTVNTFINRVVDVEDFLAPSGIVGQQYATLQAQIDATGGKDPRTDTLVTQATFLEASVRGAGSTSPNLLINPSFGDGLNNWTPSSASAWASVTGFDIGPFAQSGTANAYLFQDVPVSAGGLYSLSASMDPDNAQACYVKVDWLSSTGFFISTAGVNVYSDGWVRGYSADNAIQAPGGAAKARIYCLMAPGASGNGRFNQVQFQRGGIPTPFRDDSTSNYNGSRITSEITLRNNLAGTYATQFNSIASMFAGTQGSYLKSSIDSLSQTVSTNNQTISQRVDTLTSSIKSLSAPNLLANGGFTNGFSGWTPSNGGSGWTIYTQYSPGIYAQYNGTDDCYAYTDVYGIQPSTNYCFSFAGSSDTQGDYAHMYVEWWSANFGTLLARQEIGPSQNFNRVNYGPYNTPANTAIARVGIIGRNDSGNGAGGRKWRQIQLQQSDTPTDYSDASSLQGLQAQVTTQAGTLADISNTLNGTVVPRLSAYWQTSASVGGAQAFITAKADLGNGNTATSVAIGAQAFYVLNMVNNAWLKTFEVSGGNVMVYGNLAVAGSVSIGNMQYGAGGLYSIWYNENTATNSSTTTWQSFAQLELTPQDGQMIDGSIEFVLSSSGADTDVLYRVRRDDGTILKGPVSLRARSGGTAVSMGFVDSVPAGRDTTWFWECMKASDAVNVNMASCYGVVEEIGRGYVQHATITTAGGQGPGAGSAGGGSINGGTSQGSGTVVGGGNNGGFGNSANRQF